MTETIKSIAFSRKSLLNILTILIISGLLLGSLPFVKKGSQAADADIEENHPNSEKELQGILLTFHENTMAPLKLSYKKEIPVILSYQGGEREYRVVDAVKTTVTAYSSTVDQTNSQPFITASGERVRDGIIAANFLPFGTQVRMPEIFGDKVFVVKDRMNRRYTNRVDVWFPSRQQALNFGIRNTFIEILEEI